MKVRLETRSGHCQQRKSGNDSAWTPPNKLEVHSEADHQSPLSPEIDQWVPWPLQILFTQMSRLRPQMPAQGKHHGTHYQGWIEILDHYSKVVEGQVIPGTNHSKAGVISHFLPAKSSALGYYLLQRRERTTQRWLPQFPMWSVRR